MMRDPRTHCACCGAPLKPKAKTCRFCGVRTGG